MHLHVLPNSVHKEVCGSCKRQRNRTAALKGVRQSIQQHLQQTHLERPALPHNPNSNVECRAQATAAQASVASASPASQRGIISAHLSQDDAVAAANQQSLELLEWPAVCKQVASFCGTSMAAELLLSAQLPIGSSQAESELLLQQSQEALDLGLEVTGVFDLRPALAAAAGGGLLNPRQFEGVAASMEAAFRLKAAVAAPSQQQQQQQQGAPSHQQQGDITKWRQQQQRQQQYSCLADVAAAIDDQEMILLRAIRSCISDGGILSSASEDLSSIRSARQANRDRARKLVTEIARNMYSQGAAEGKEPLVMRGRYCVAVRSNHRSAVGKGSVKLGASGSGATVYIEPAEVLELNNKEALLSEQEAAAELAVLAALSQLLAQRAAAVQGMLQAVTDLDIIAARAKHAVWLDAVRPVFAAASSSSSSNEHPRPQGAVEKVQPAAANHNVSWQQQQRQQQQLGNANVSTPMHLPGARHPLLMQVALPPLPKPPAVEDAAFESDFVAPPLWAATSSSSSGSDSDDESHSQSVTKLGSARQLPKPLDLRVPSGVNVVAITGPNTGGKTVALKTAGLCALMAKAGLFIPIDRQELAAAAAAAAATGNGSSSSSSSGLVHPTVLWFDQILADIGDAQSLQQNLSTFSGHIRRLRLLLAAAGPGSLVLLDEVGSGTDPQEGAALARAVLDVLAGQARLTMATSHHAELKTAADEDQRYVNVSMEFNTMTLRPTYKLCWGSAGSSNALDIAQALGFDSKVLAEARILARAQLPLHHQQQQQQGTMEQVASSIEAQLMMTQSRIAALHNARREREQKAEAYRDKTRQLMGLRNTLRGRSVLVDREQAEMVLQVQQAAKGVRRNEADLADVQSVIDFYNQKITNKSPDDGVTNTNNDIKPGDDVIVPSLVLPDVADVAGRAKEAVEWMKFKVIKVEGDDIWVDYSLMSTIFSGSKFGSKGSKGTRVPRSRVLRADQIHLPQEGLVGLGGYDSQQAAAEQQMIDDADSILAGQAKPLQQQQQKQVMEQQSKARGGVEYSAKAAVGQQEQKQQKQQEYAQVKQSRLNTLGVEGWVPEAAVDELLDVIQAHIRQASSSSASNNSSQADGNGDKQFAGLQETGGSGLLEGGVLYVQHGTRTGAVKRAVIKCVEQQQKLGLVRKYKAGQEGSAAGRTVVWLQT